MPTRDPYGTVGNISDVTGPSNMFQFLSQGEDGKWQFNSLDDNDVRLEDTQFNEAYQRALNHRDSMLNLVNGGFYRPSNYDGEANASNQMNWDRLSADPNYKPSIPGMY